MSIHVCCACGKPIPDEATFCPQCGAEQTEDIRLNKIPETIEELRDFCAAHHMPLEKMRFFIGEDYRGARAFGIFKDKNGNCVVYKNKADGSRAVRYQGPDEKRAVRELYDKLKSETELRRAPGRGGTSVPARGGVSAPVRGGTNSASKSFALSEKLVGIGILCAALLLILGSCSFIIRVFKETPDKGYYRYEDKTYYNRYGTWYSYDEAAGDWLLSDVVPDLLLGSTYGDYYLGHDYDMDYGVLSFPWEDDSGGSYDYDDDDDGWFWDSDSSYDDYDWDDSDWDSWDSSDTDWDSDW